MDELELCQSAMNTARVFDRHYAISDEELHAIITDAVRLNRFSTIVELGVCNGSTGAALARTCMETMAIYFGVDFFGLENSKDNLDEMFVKYSLPGYIIEGRTQDLGLKWRHPIDLMLIDAGHDEANIRLDCELWLQHVKPGGVVYFHDHDGNSNQSESPHWAVTHYADLHTFGWPRTRITHNMIRVVKPTPSVPSDDKIRTMIDNDLGMDEGD